MQPIAGRRSARPSLAFILILGLAAGCAQLPAPDGAARLEPLPVPADGGRAQYERADEAARRVGTRAPASDDEAPTDPADENFWNQLAVRFAFAECTEGSPAATWAIWYAERPDYLDRVLDRARPWLHDIATELEQRELPGELVLLPIVESAYNPFAYSHGQAAGTWQFLAATGREYGLDINPFYDGRRDTWSATRAALDYLTVLVERFDGDWNLALAAYNGGQGRVHRAIQRNQARGRSTEWHALTLPRETLAYVPKVNGLGCLFREPEAFGIELPEVPNEPLINIVELPGQADIVRLAVDNGLDIAEVAVLNAGLNGHLTPPAGPHRIVVPAGQAVHVNDLPDMRRSPAAQASRQVTIRRGDTLSTLARRHGTTVSALREMNGLNGDRIVAGQQLKVAGNPALHTDPAYAEHYAELARLQRQLVPAPALVHRVAPGESLWTIARQHRVTIAQLQSWNNLRGTVIRPGQRLTVRPPGR